MRPSPCFLISGLVQVPSLSGCSGSPGSIQAEDNSFEFEHQWMIGKDPSLELEQDVIMDADLLWQHDLRSLEFKISEKDASRA